MDRLTIGETLEGFGFYGTPIYDRPILLKLERHGTVVCEVSKEKSPDSDTYLELLKESV